MPLPNRTKAFDKSLDKALSKYPKSKEGLERGLENIDRTSGDRYPGFQSAHLRKCRLPLSEYNISSRKGLRVVFLVTDGGSIVPVVVYKKGQPQRETEVVRLIKSALKDVLTELRSHGGPA
ncbi:MAG: hypothetical protein RDU30_03475 [Desulfovibrionaceae bacterium]|nr:hypothetical protein [Desulfovibrionaceae bacterium]